MLTLATRESGPKLKSGAQVEGRFPNICSLLKKEGNFFELLTMDDSQG